MITRDYLKDWVKENDVLSLENILVHDILEAVSYFNKRIESNETNDFSTKMEDFLYGRLIQDSLKILIGPNDIFTHPYECDKLRESLTEITHKLEDRTSFRIIREELNKQKFPHYKEKLDKYAVSSLVKLRLTPELVKSAVEMFNDYSNERTADTGGVIFGATLYLVAKHAAYTNDKFARRTIKDICKAIGVSNIKKGLDKLGGFFEENPKYAEIINTYKSGQ